MKKRLNGNRNYREVMLALTVSAALVGVGKLLGKSMFTALPRSQGLPSVHSAQPPAATAYGWLGASATGVAEPSHSALGFSCLPPQSGG